MLTLLSSIALKTNEMHISITNIFNKQTDRQTDKKPMDGTAPHYDELPSPTHQQHRGERPTPAACWTRHGPQRDSGTAQLAEHS